MLQLAALVQMLPITFCHLEIAIRKCVHLSFVETSIIFKGIEKNITIFIVPGLERNLYLGVAFWHLYNLLPLGLERSCSSGSVNEIENQISLSLTQKHRLNQVINSFPSFAIEGLGKTNIL